MVILASLIHNSAKIYAAVTDSLHNLRFCTDYMQSWKQRFSVLLCFCIIDHGSGATISGTASNVSLLTRGGWPLTPRIPQRQRLTELTPQLHRLREFVGGCNTALHSPISIGNIRHDFCTETTQTINYTSAALKSILGANFSFTQWYQQRPTPHVGT